MKIVFRVEEVCNQSYTRYKYYTMPETLTYPTEWKNWSVNEKYTWVNDSCYFDSDYAEATDSEITEEIATEMEERL